MIIDLLENERLDDLQRNGYKIIQKVDGFCFGMDAVLLSAFTVVKENESVLDLGTGTGVIPLLLDAKTKAKHITGLEIQPQIAEMAMRSVLYNHLQDKITIVNGDIKEASQIFDLASFDVVTSNPPYMNDLHGLKNPNEVKAISRHEVLCKLEDVVKNTSGVLKPGGRFYLVHRPHRLIEIITLLTKYRLEPKRIRLVHPYRQKEANMVLKEAVRGGGSMVKVEPPLIVYEETGIYTEEVYHLYGMEKDE